MDIPVEFTVQQVVDTSQGVIVRLKGNSRKKVPPSVTGNVQLTFEKTGPEWEMPLKVGDRFTATLRHFTKEETDNE